MKTEWRVQEVRRDNERVYVIYRYCGTSRTERPKDKEIRCFTKSETTAWTVADRLNGKKPGEVILNGDTVKMLREYRGISMGELARRAGVSRPLISLVEARRRRAIPAVSERIMRALGVVPEETDTNNEALHEAYRGIDAVPSEAV